MNQRGFAPIVLILVVIMISGLVIGGAYYYKSITNKTVEPTTQNDFPSPQYTQRKAAESEKEVLVKEIPNFDNLKLNDLPIFSDVRSVYKYGENVIAVGYSKIAEFDSISKKFVRVNKNESFGSIDSGVLVGDYLYISGNRPDNNPNDFPPKRMIYKIDLRTGMLAKTLFADDPRRFANLALTEQGGEIWGSSWDGVLRINPQNDTVIKIYDYNELGLKEPSCPFNIFVKDNILTVFSNCYDTGFSRYNEVTDEWTYKKETDTNDAREYPKMINRRFPDFGLDLPAFSYISNKVNNKYYIFSDKGVYVLKRGQFPEFLTDAKVKGSYAVGEVGEDVRPKIYVTKDERFIVLIGANICGLAVYDTCSPLATELVNLKDHKIADLLRDNDEYNQLQVEERIKLMERIQKSKLEELENEIVLKNPDGSSLVKIDLNAGQLDIL